MHQIIPNNGMQQMYTIPPQQQIPPPISTRPFTMNMPPQQFVPNPINTNQYQPHTSYAPPLTHQHYHPHHAPQASINGLPYVQAYTATSPVDNYSIYNGSVYNVATHSQPPTHHPSHATHAPPPSVVSNPPHTTPHQQYRQLMAMRNAQAQAFRQSMNIQMQKQHQEHMQKQPQPQHHHNHNVQQHHIQQAQVQQQQQQQQRQQVQQQQEIKNNVAEEVVEHEIEEEVEEDDDGDIVDDDDGDNNEEIEIEMEENNNELDDDIVDDDDDDDDDDGNDINDLLEGDAILAGEFVGIIRYLGPLFLNPFNTSAITKEQYIGIECSSQSETDGKGHDGWYKDFRYFKTKKSKNTGLLIQSSKFTKKLSPFRLLQTIKKQKNATDQLQQAMESVKTQNKLLKLNLEALLLQQHKMKQFCAKCVKYSKNGTFNISAMEDNDSPLPMLARKSNHNDTPVSMISHGSTVRSRRSRRKSRTLTEKSMKDINKKKKKAKKTTENTQNIQNTQKTENMAINPNKSTSISNKNSKSNTPVTPVTPEPLKGIKQRSTHTAEATVELSIHLDRLEPAGMNPNVANKNTPTDRMLDELQNTQGLSRNDIVNGTAKHVILQDQQPVNIDPQMQQGHSSQSLQTSDYRNSQGSMQYLDNNYNPNQYVEQMSQTTLSNPDLMRGITQSSIGTMGTMNSMGTPTPTDYNSNMAPQLQQNLSSASGLGFPQYQPQNVAADPYTVQMNGQYYTTAGGPPPGYGYNPGVIQEAHPQQHYYSTEASNNNNKNHPQQPHNIEMNMMIPNAYAHAPKGYNSGYSSGVQAASPGIDSNNSYDRYSQFLKKLVVAPQQFHTGPQQAAHLQQLQANDPRLMMNGMNMNGGGGVNMNGPNDDADDEEEEEEDEGEQNRSTFIDDMDDDGIIRGTPIETITPIENLTPLEDESHDTMNEEDLMAHRNSSKSSREYYTGSASSKHMNKQGKKNKQKNFNNRHHNDKNYGLHPSGIRMATNQQYADQYANYSGDSSPDKSPNNHSHKSKKSKNKTKNKNKSHKKGNNNQNNHGGHHHGNQWYSPANSVHSHSSPITKRKRKYSGHPNDNLDSPDSHSEYPNTYQNNLKRKAHHSQAIIDDENNKKLMKKKNKKGLKMKQIRTSTPKTNFQNSPPLTAKQIHKHEYRSYINIDTPTAASLSTTISASNIINLDHYQQPSPLSIINKDKKKYTEKLLLKDQDTLSSDALHATHKTVDLPSPNTHNRKKKKKKVKKNKKKARSYYDDEDMEVLDDYEVYNNNNSITQTEEESPEPKERRRHDHIEANHHDSVDINKRKLQLLNKASAETDDQIIIENELTTQDEITTDEFEAADTILTVNKFGNNNNIISNGNNINKPRFSTLSIDSEIDITHNLIVEDESLMDEPGADLLSPRAQNSKIIEFYVPKSMNNDQIKMCFGLFSPIKIIPHLVQNHELQGDNKKVEAIFEDNATAMKAVQMLKNHNFHVAFKKSPRQTLVSDNRQTPILQPISSQGPFTSFGQQYGSKPDFSATDSVSTAGGQEDGFGKINYRPHRVGAIINSGDDEDGDGDNNENSSYEWTEGSSGASSNDDDEDEESQVWALELGFSGTSDDNDIDEMEENEDNDLGTANMRNIVSN